MVDFDIGVVGASGVTGREIVRYLTARADETGVSWCAAGRDRGKIGELLNEAGCAQEILTVDLDEETTVDELVARVAVVVNATGPYGRLGTILHAKCAEAGRHHVDLCADVGLIKQIVETCGEVASTTGARLVHSAGFLSLPFDLAARRAAEHASQGDDAVFALDVAVHMKSDGPMLTPADVFSSGTVAGTADAIRRGGELAPTDARYLVPEPHEPVPIEDTAREYPATGKWVAPLIPTPHVNPIVVNRSISLRPDGFDPAFRYRDGLVTEGLVPGIPDSFTAAWMAGTQMMSSMLRVTPAPMRSLIADSIEAFGPATGGGPSPDRMGGWTWRLEVYSVTKGGAVFSFDVLGLGHPGYRSSANLVAESAVLLAADDEAGPGGVLTPAAAFGSQLERFAAAGMDCSPIRSR